MPAKDEMRALFKPPVMRHWAAGVVLFLWASVGMSVPAGKPGQSAIASAHPLATEAGLAILDQGGNAFDAAVTVTAVLAVAEPYSSGMGGGGFYLLQQGNTVTPVFLDAREKAPLKAHKDMYLDEQGEVVPGLSVDGVLAAGIPGIPAALVHLADRYGHLPLSRSLAPAIRIAREGFVTDKHYQQMAGFRHKALLSGGQAGEIFLENGQVPEPGFVVKQPDLARVLEAMAEQGRDGFYAGWVARDLVQGVRSAGGLWTQRDLNAYRVIERAPVRFRFRDMVVTSAPPPSSGGIALAQMLNILEGFDLDALSKPERVHLVVEAMRRAYRDRAEYLGDSDFVPVPLARLTGKAYAATLRRGIDSREATPSSVLKPVSGAGAVKGTDTTHFSILDSEGNKVSATLSINYPFGSGYVVPGTGILLNDEMDDFSAKPGTPNVYGLVGAEANAIEPGKRMLSSMSPSFLQQGDRVALVGTPGGSRIITMVLLAAMEFQKGAGAQEMVSLPRYHHQYLPDRLQLEPKTFSEDVRSELSLIGHELAEQSRTWGNMQAVVWDRNSAVVEAASDPRGGGSAQVRSAQLRSAQLRSAQQRPAVMEAE